jgi:hypothetical protein
MQALKWQLLEILDVPCADISYQWVSEQDAYFVIVMHFSKVKDGSTQDLEITFGRPIAVQWEEESYGLIELPDNLPQCSRIEFSNFTYPTLIVTDSRWANLYASRSYSEEEYKNHNVRHFVFISMNDILHVLSNEEPKYKFIPAKNA